MRLTATERSPAGRRPRLGAVLRAAAIAIAAGAAAPGCASVGGGAGGAPSAVRFSNTTDACPRPQPLTVSVEGGGASWPVPPGGEVLIPLPPGGHVAEVRALAEVLERRPWNVGATGVLEDWVGCAAPEFTRAGPGRALVRLDVPAAACEPGLHGPVSVTLGGRPVARLGRGESALRWLPVGASALDLEGRALLVDVAPGGGPGASARRVVLGCEPDPVALAAAGISPLVILGPPLGCGPSPPMTAHAAGGAATLGAGEAWTVFVPAGRHAVSLAVGDAPARAEVIEVASAPVVLASGSGPGCARAAGGPRGARALSTLAPTATVRP